MIDKAPPGTKVWVHSNPPELAVVASDNDPRHLLCHVQLENGVHTWFSWENVYASKEDLARALILEAAGVKE